MKRRHYRRRRGRRAPAPEFRFDTVAFMDEGRLYGHMLRITCLVEGEEQGYILLDEYRHAVLLRDALTRFIDKFRLD